MKPEPNYTQYQHLSRSIDPLKKGSIAWTSAIVAFSTLLVAFGLLLLNGRFLFAPGIPIQLPKASDHMIQHIETMAVLTSTRDDVFFFDTKCLSINELKPAFIRFLTENPGGYHLLIKTDRFTPLESFLLICDMAQQAGFQSIQIATTTKEKPITWEMTH